ncbi:MAG: hypothetical protein ACU841_03535 [Gammaproteobacteria bacterium]
MNLSAGLGGSVLAADIFTRHSPGLLPYREAIDDRILGFNRPDSFSAHRV